MEQRSLFDSVLLRAAHLVARSPRNAFYQLRLERVGLRFRVGKASGAGGRVLDVRNWEFGSFEEANRFFERTLREKTNPGRRSPRKYQVTQEEGGFL